VNSITLAGGPVSWGVDFADALSNPLYGEVLDGIAAARLGWLELGPVGYLPRDRARVRGELEARGLAAVGTFVFDDFHRPDAAEAVLDATDAALDAIADAGGRLLVLIDRPSAERAATAGHSAHAPRLGARAWTAMVDVLRRAGARANARGIRAVVHPHVGGYIEFEDEIERLLADAPADELGLCLDTGHALYAGADPAALIRRYRQRLEHLHLKDLSPAGYERTLAFWDAVRAGAFCPLGAGRLDLADLRGALMEIGYDGFATVEQDRRLDSPGDPATDLRRSVTRLRDAGIGHRETPQPASPARDDGP
jgi:inosose dehydratase